MSEPTLFDAPRPGDYRHTDPLPSRRAAALNLTARQTIKKRMLARLLAGPATARDLADLCGGQRNVASKRLGEMRDAGLLVACGYEYHQGTPRTIYALTDNGRRDAELMTGGAG